MPSNWKTGEVSRAGLIAEGRVAGAAAVGFRREAGREVVAFRAGFLVCAMVFSGSWSGVAMFRDETRARGSAPDLCVQSGAPRRARVVTLAA
jgi:hypothetical protein